MSGARSAGARQEWIDTVETGAGGDIAGNAAGIDGCSTRNTLLPSRRVLIHSPAFSARCASAIVTPCAFRMELLAREDRTIVALAELVATAAASESVAFAVAGAGIGTGLLWKTLSSDWVVRQSTVCAGCSDVPRRTKACSGAAIAVTVGPCRTVVLAVIVSRTDHSWAPTESIIGGEIDGGQRVGLVSRVHCGLGRNLRINHDTDEATLVRTKRLVDIVRAEDAIGIGAAGRQQECAE